MRVLFSTGSPARYMSPPQLGDEQVNCGPDWADESAPDGRVRSLKTPVGDYDLAAIAAKLPPDQQPDVVVCLVDASWRNVPRNLGAFKCPRVLLVADTHHLRSPLIGMMRYLSGESFDRAVFLYDRHHAAFFHAAGLRNLFWLPGLTFPHGDAAVRAARCAASERVARIGFVGQTGKIHPRRTRLLGALGAAGLPVAAQPLAQAEALGFYGQSLLGFNASLNGDLNLRVFEILASGAGLLTDRLAPESGLATLFGERSEAATYGNSADLVKLARHYLAKPVEARALGVAGAKKFDALFNEARRRAAFRAVAFDGVALPQFEFSATETTRVFFGGDTDRLLQSLMVYEGVQELHRTRETVRVALDGEGGAGDFAAICATLPRVAVEKEFADGTADLAVIGRTASAQATRLWCWDAAENDFDGLAARFAPQGFSLVSRDVAVLCRPDEPVAATPTPKIAADEAAQARALFKQGNFNGALALARAALEHDPRSVAARVLLGELALRNSDGGEAAEKLFRQALELDRRDAVIETLLAEALRAQKKFSAAGKVLARVLKTHPRHLPYGLEIGGGRENTTNMPLQQLARLVCARSERQKLAYATHCAPGDGHIVVTGHAKLDALRDLPHADTAELDAFAAGRKVVGWNPHFDMRPNGTKFGAGFSTFLGYAKFIVAEFARRPDLALVMRPHPLLFGTLLSRKIWTQAEIDGFLADVVRAGNIHIDRNASYLPLFARAEAMISDASSFVLEFTATGKPLLFLANPAGPVLNEDGSFVTDHLYNAADESDIARFLDQVSAGADPMGAGRRAAYPDYMHRPAEGVGVAIKHAISERLATELNASTAVAPERELAAV